MTRESLSQACKAYNTILQMHLHMHQPKVHACMRVFEWQQYFSGEMLTLIVLLSFLDTKTCSFWLNVVLFVFYQDIFQSHLRPLCEIVTDGNIWCDIRMWQCAKLWLSLLSLIPLFVRAGDFEVTKQVAALAHCTVCLFVCLGLACLYALLCSLSVLSSVL